jgi:hypothetical protein
MAAALKGRKMGVKNFPKISWASNWITHATGLKNYSLPFVFFSPHFLCSQE